jgi:hypothetical protein
LQLISALFTPYAPKTMEAFTEIAEFLDKHLGKQGVSQEG